MTDNATEISFDQIVFLAEQQKGSDASSLIKTIKTGMTYNQQLTIQYTQEEQEELKKQLQEKQEQSETSEAETPASSRQQHILLSANKDLLFVRLTNSSDKNKSSNSTVNIYDIASKRTLSMTVKRNNLRDVEVKAMDDKTYQACLKYAS